MKNGQSIQDAVFDVATPHCTVLALADGATSCENGGIGAQIACRAAGEYLMHAGKSMLAFDDRKTAFLVLEQVLCHLRKEAEKSKASLESYASTLLLCYIDYSSKEAMILHLGDGAVYQTSGNDCRLLSSPVNTQENACVLTTMRKAYRDAKVRRIKVENDTTIFLCSDGIHNLMRDVGTGNNIRMSVAAKDYDGLCRQIDALPLVDDGSFLLHYNT